MNLVDLPLEILTYIASFFGARDRHNFGNINKYIYMYWYKHDICNKLPKNIYFQEGFFINQRTIGAMNDINKLISMVAQYIRSIYDKNDISSSFWFRYFTAIATKEIHGGDDYRRSLRFPIILYPENTIVYLIQQYPRCSCIRSKLCNNLAHMLFKIYDYVENNFGCKITDREKLENLITNK